VTLDAEHLDYLANHRQGRLATVGTDGSPQVKPVGYRYNGQLGTIDIGGFNMENSAKFHNVATNPQVAFVVDDAIGEGASGMRFVEVRGLAEQVTSEEVSDDTPRSCLIRIHPRRIVSWNIVSGEPSFKSANLADGVGASGSGRPTLGLGGAVRDEAMAAAEHLVEELQKGWDQRDADISNRHVSADVLWGSPFGESVSGYEDLHAIHVRLKKEGRGGPSSRYEVAQVHAPAPGVALAQVFRVAVDSDGAALEGSTDFTGQFSEMALYVLVRRGGTWWLAAGQNTPLRPEKQTSAR
jgi:PPOX class F420-dependent enzyme/OxyR family protein